MLYGSRYVEIEVTKLKIFFTLCAHTALHLGKTHYSAFCYPICLHQRAHSFKINNQ